MKYNLKNKLWQLDPHMARAMFEAELREMLEASPKIFLSHRKESLIKEILGES